jgi:zinc-ribbon domain
MFCDKCGSPISSGAQFCSACGKATGAAPIATAPNTARPASDRRVQRHVQVLASLWLANGILRFLEVGTILIAGQVLPFLMTWGMGGRYANWPFTFLPFGLYGIAGILAFFGVAHLLLAWALFQREPWARMLGLVLGFLALLRPPFGTALGIYTLWVLLPQQSAQEYDQLSSSSVQAGLQHSR